MVRSTFFSLLGFLLYLSPEVYAGTGLLYFTNFDNFPVGDNEWAGHDGWFTNTEAESNGIQGIDAEAVPGIEQSAFLGFKQPEVTWNFVARTIDHDPVKENSAAIEVDTLIGIEESTNGNYDSFFVSFYNIQGDFLAAIQFSNEREAFGIYREDGFGPVDTTVDFLHGELQLLNVTINLQENTWSADFDGIPLFENATFTKTTHTRTFGSIAYEWQTTSDLAENYGNNWLLVADCSIWAVPPGEEEVLVQGLEFEADGEAKFQFLGEPGWTYQVEYTGSLGDWHDDLANSNFPIAGQAQMVEFTDETSQRTETRFYRINRQVTP